MKEIVENVGKKNAQISPSRSLFLVGLLPLLEIGLFFFSLVLLIGFFFIRFFLLVVRVLFFFGVGFGVAGLFPQNEEKNHGNDGSNDDGNKNDHICGQFSILIILLFKKSLHLGFFSFQLFQLDIKISLFSFFCFLNLLLLIVLSLSLL